MNRDEVAHKILRRFARYSLVTTHWFIKRMERAGEAPENIAEVRELCGKLEKEIHHLEDDNDTA